MRDWVTMSPTFYYFLGRSWARTRTTDGVVIFIRDRPGGAGAVPDIDGHCCPMPWLLCDGGGSNALGIFDAFIGDPSVRLIGVEQKAGKR